MDEQLFADGVGAIAITGMTVRIDLVTLSPKERDASGQPAMEFCQRVILPLDGFMQFAVKIQEAAQAAAKIHAKAPPAQPAADIAPKIVPAPAPIQPAPIVAAPAPAAPARPSEPKSRFP